MSTGGCIAVAPPGQTDLVYAMSVENLIADRSSPFPEMVFNLNLTKDGTSVDPLAADIETAMFSSLEVLPNGQRH
jgi:hypothetical protein